VSALVVFTKRIECNGSDRPTFRTCDPLGRVFREWDCISGDSRYVNCPAHGGAGLVSELGVYPDEGDGTNPRFGVTVPDFRAS
jgi:hypothetical protein